MERHQAGQEETLVEMRMDMESLEAIHRPRGSPSDRRCCFKCVVALVAVMALVIVALVLGFIFHYFTFTPSSIQSAAPLRDTGKVNIACKLKESEEKGRYDIFTTDKATRYLIYGWVKLTNVVSENISLRQVLNGDDKVIETKKSGALVYFFVNSILLVDNSRMSIYFNSSCTDNLFHVYEL